MAVDEADQTGQLTAEAFERLLLHEFRCGSCGYGIAVQRQPPVCPMCGASSSWQPPRRLEPG
jgi:rubrerythrin